MTLLENRIRDLETRDTGNPIVIYQTNAGQSIPNAAETVIDFEDMINDPHLLVTVADAPATWFYTVPVSGYYLVTALIVFETTNTWAVSEVVRIRPLVNGSGAQYAGRGTAFPASSTAVSVLGVVPVYAVMDDTIAIGVYQNSGAALTLATNAGFNVASIHRIGAG
jgi:hypothetical protein